ncbi:polymer-forming cytoskeletal protein [Marinobacter adhaerens]|uniref:Polymer-forming cytoskeletal protein n=1 Tax=Marinobacter adhaerens TaxID=1033846 RepID=A0A851I1G1_9GAMM|nr:MULTISPECIES: polymer-forming cytoskeletal protein [Marinobacter]NWN92925.1 polymer-forming cytoskeletal protein [Marinobacter adhaerens]
MFGKKQQKARRPAGSFDTLISSHTAIEGDVRFSGGLHIDGRVQGRVLAEDGGDAVLRISEVGEVVGDIAAPRVIVNGTVHGDVYASEHLELAGKAAVNGSVYYNLIEMAMGASVNGNLVHQHETSRLLTQESESAEEEPHGLPGAGLTEPS